MDIVGCSSDRGCEKRALTTFFCFVEYIYINNSRQMRRSVPLSFFFKRRATLCSFFGHCVFLEFIAIYIDENIYRLKIFINL